MAEDSQAIGTDDVIRRRRRTQVLDKLIGDAEPFVQIRDQLSRLSESEATVLISGETGTGKELTARALHYLSSKGGFPFVAVNCAALPDTLLEDELFGHERGAFTDAHAPRPGLLAQAHRGTIFLDEVESLSTRAQGALLRVLHDRTFRTLGSSVERSVEVRFVAATNVDLAALVQHGAFRANLFYRLRVLWLELPPLRERRSDIPLLTGHFLTKHASRTRPAPALSPAAAPGPHRVPLARQYPRARERHRQGAAPRGRRRHRAAPSGSAGGVADSRLVRDLVQRGASLVQRVEAPVRGCLRAGIPCPCDRRVRRQCHQGRAAPPRRSVASWESCSRNTVSTRRTSPRQLIVGWTHPQPGASSPAARRWCLTAASGPAFSSCACSAVAGVLTPDASGAIAKSSRILRAAGANLDPLLNCAVVDTVLLGSARAPITIAGQSKRSE